MGKLKHVLADAELLPMAPDLNHRFRSNDKRAGLQRLREVFWVRRGEETLEAGSAYARQPLWKGFEIMSDHGKERRASENNNERLDVFQPISIAIGQTKRNFMMDCRS
jgi:hypothetical protein